LTGETEKSNSARFFMTGKRATPSPEFSQRG
jgi:hypothetical protein